MRFTIRLADVAIGIRSIYDEVHALCADYLTNDPPAFTVATTPDDLARERERALREAAAEGHTPIDYPLPYLETLAVYRQIATHLTAHGAFLVHGAVVAADGAAYLFAAPSGTGKTTHARLWLAEVPSAFVVNGDKPLLRVGAGVVYACGTPWAGKEGLQRNCQVPLAGICLLERGEVNTLTPVAFADALPALLQQTYRPSDALALQDTLALLRRVGELVPLYRLRCTPDAQAARVAHRTLSGHGGTSSEGGR